MLYTHVAAALIAAALAGYAGWTARSWKANSDEAHLRDTAEETRRLRETSALRANQEIDRAKAKKDVAIAARNAADRDELERLRIAAAARDAQPPAAACEPVEEQFQQCRAALERGAGMVVRGAALVRELDSANDGLRRYAAEVGGVHLTEP